MLKSLGISLKLLVRRDGTFSYERDIDLLAKEKIFFILISSDYVFDGKNPPYKETDTPNPLQTYGKSKYEAELVTQKASSGEPFTSTFSKCRVR